MTTATTLTLAHLQTALQGVQDEAAVILAAAALLPVTAVTTTVSIDIPGGVRLPDGSCLTEVRVSTSRAPGEEPFRQAEGWVLTPTAGRSGRQRAEYRRLDVSLVDALIGRAAL